MLQRLKAQFFMSEIEKQLQKAKVNKSHDFIMPKHILLVTSLLSSPKSKTQLVSTLIKKFHSSDSTLRTKCLIMLHSCLRKQFDDSLIQILLNEETPNQGSQFQDSQQQQQKQKIQENLDTYIKKNVINFYLLYLKKVCLNRDSFLYIKNFTRKEIYTETSNTHRLQHEQNLEIVAHGFKILNLCNYILNSQEMFNKMGRYHIEFQEILAMYMQLLEDLTLFNAYIKASVKVILDRYNENRNSFEDCTKFLKLDSNLDELVIGQGMKKEKNQSSTTKAQSSNTIPEETLNADQAEQIKHYFLYINQCQKISDRLYQYYHNRYYYKILRSIIIFPTFLTIENKEYSRIRNRTKRVDRNLVNLVKMSKYGENSMVHYRTEPTLGGTKSFNMTTVAENKGISMDCRDGNFTQIYEVDEEENPYEKIRYGIMGDQSDFPI